MYFKRLIQSLLLVSALMTLGGCELTDDLTPSSEDKRPDVTAGTIGNYPGQIAADFTQKDSLSQDYTLSENLSGGSTPADAIVLYFTMWCPICLGHSDHMVYAVEPQFATRGNVQYLLVDYVSGSVTTTRAQQLANGYAAFTTLADIDLTVFNQFDAAMGTTIVLDTNGTILMNEDYKDGSKLIDVLDTLLP